MVEETSVLVEACEHLEVAHLDSNWQEHFAVPFLEDLAFVVVYQVQVRLG